MAIIFQAKGLWRNLILLKHMANSEQYDVDQ